MRSEDLEATLDGEQRPTQNVLAPRPGDALGRYRLLECVGQGAMGSVFAAYDPELDRRVAIKLLHSARDEALLAEARALAKLSHPNVVAVYDVGRVPEGAFIAMEFVVGRTLRRWLEAGSRAPADVLAVFDAAGSGLAAAHAAGVVHRDFKPENVLIGDDGRVRVGDFGLARTLGTAVAATGDTTASSSTTRQAGTPAYMAPELFLGGTADARSDEFSFCVALWEALFGARPFVGRTVPELLSAVIDAVQPPSDTGEIPGHVVVALRRGLDADPRRRFGDLPALLSALRPVRRARRWPWIAAGGLGVAGLALAVRVAGGASRCDTAWPAWSSSTAATLRTTLAGVDAPDAEAVADATIDDLQRYAAAQEEVQGEVCRLRRAEPLAAAVIEACVLRMRDDAEAILAVLAAPDREVWMATATLRASLGAPLDCLDPELARRRAPVDTDPQAIARAAPVRAALAQARVEQAAGRLDAAAAIVDRVETDVDELDAPALRGEHALARADLLHDRGDTETAVASAYEAVAWATRAADRRTAAAAWTELIFLEGYARTDEIAARLAMRQSEAELAALGGDDEIAADRMSRISAAEFAAGRLDDAIAAATESIAAHRRRGDDLAAATVLMNLVSMEIVAVRYDDAERRLAEVEEIWRARLPAGHPDLARIPEVRSRLAGERGDAAAQVALAEQAYALRSAAVGDAHPEALTVLSYFIGTLLASGEIDRALALSERLYTGARDQPRATVQLDAARTRAEVLRTAGRPAEARVLVDEVMRLAAAELPDDSPRLVDLFELRTELALDLGDLAAALADQREARRRIGAIWGDDHVYAGIAESTIAGILLGLERRAEASEAVARGAAIEAALTETAATLHLELAASLAVVAWELGERDRAIELAARAHALVAREGLEDSEHARALAEHPVSVAQR